MGLPAISGGLIKLWHLWGSKADLDGEFKVDAINIKSGEKINPFIFDIPTSLFGPLTVQMHIYHPQ